MYHCKEYEKLKKEYGSYSSWAIWNEYDQEDTNVIEKNVEKLNTRYVFVGLNVSKKLKSPSWSNFHGGKHDRKLTYACSGNKLSGCYITDLFKDIPTTKECCLKALVEWDPKILKKNIESFREEMKNIGVNEDTIFIILGNVTKEYFIKYFQDGHKNNPVYHRHYSSRGKDVAWINELWGKLGINKVFKKD